MPEKRKGYEMAQDSRQAPPVDRMGWSFGQLLAWHFLRGTRPGGKVDQPGRKWSTKAFADAVGVGDRTIRYWLRNEHLPPEIETVERLLFGNDTCYDDWRLELRQAHAGSADTKGRAVAAGQIETDLAPRPAKAGVASNIPIRVPPHFMGREDALVAIETALARYPDRVAVTALHGLRGVGKTTLAAAFAERHRGEYRVTWWIRAQTEPSMRADMVALGARLGWVGTDDKEEPALAAVLEQLGREDGATLLIYDNAISADALKPYLPRAGAARVLVTSNSYAWRGVADPVEIGVWPKQTGAGYLIARTGRDGERESAEALSEILGGLPLAHEQAAAYCERLEISLAEYARRFAAAPARLLDDARDAPAEYHDRRTVAKTFALAIEEAGKLHPAAESLIMHAGLLPPEPIPLFLFVEGRELFEPPLAAALGGEGLDETVAVLRSFALINRESIVDERDSRITTDTIRLHRLVREVAAGQRAEEARQARCTLVKVLAMLYPKDAFDNPRSWPRARRLEEHAQALLGAEDGAPLMGVEEETSHLLDRVASYRHAALAAYERARPLFQRALAIREKMLGGEHPLTAASLNNLARLLWDEGDLAGAQPLFERSLAIRERTLGRDHARTAASLNNLSSLLQSRGDPVGARPLSERALAICERTLGPEHPGTAASLANLARVLRDLREFEAAQPIAERALAIRERLLGPEHPRTAASLNNLASVLHGQGEVERARELFERALTICEDVLGPEHPYTAVTLNNLAILLWTERDLAQARPLFERALEIRENVLGPAHPLTATSLNGLANVLRAQGDAAAARLLHERALAIQEKALGAKHPDTAASLDGLANVFRDQGDLAGAQPFYERAVAIREKTVARAAPSPG
jgi:tetratricopeptide (TPR) repeat protein